MKKNKPAPGSNRGRQALSRRDLFVNTAVLVAGSAVGTACASSHQAAVLNNTDRGRAQSGKNTMKTIQFKNNDIKMAGNVYFPADFSEAGKYPAVICVHPGGGVKEQTAGLYAQSLAAQGFVTLAFDASHQGASGGMPRLLDDPMKRVGDIYSAVDYLSSLPYVDAKRIGALGICAGSGATIKAASNERRIKAVATVSAVDVGAAIRKGWDGKTPSDQIAMLESVAKQRTAEAAGAEPVYVPYVPQVGDSTAPRDLREAADLYLTPRGQHPNAPNKMLLTSLACLVSFTAFDQVATLLTQPVLIVAGNEAGSLWHSQELHAKAAGPKELFIIEGAAHMDLHDGPGATRAMNRLVPFFKREL